MGHKANTSFFDTKRPWSERKDLILAYYLTPYLPKIATQRRPILVVDAFAGPGQFKDGKPGSPLIICDMARKANAKPLRVPVRVLAIEADEGLFRDLDELLSPFDFAERRHRTFLDAVPEIEAAAATHSVFLYIDPWTVGGLEWEALARVFAHLRTGQSVEILMNFNARSLVRRGLSALRMSVPDEPEDEDDDVSAAPPSLAKLNDVVGGEWWQKALRDTEGFPEQVNEVATGFCNRLRKHFREVCVHAIKASAHHLVPKYFVIFGSRSPDALRLMNDAMVKSREKFAESELPADDTLFEMRSFELVPDESALPQIILDALVGKMAREELIVAVMRSNLGVYSETAIRRGITELIKTKQIKSATGKARINDSVHVWRTP